MGQTFDPYHKWLGINPSEQPADHYRLLGLSRFEPDSEAIEHAADRQMGHVRTFQNGPHSEDSQKLLNEIAAARVCLLNPKKKAEYDGQLRARMAPPEPPPQDPPQLYTSPPDVAPPRTPSHPPAIPPGPIPVTVPRTGPIPVIRSAHAGPARTATASSPFVEKDGSPPLVARLQRNSSKQAMIGVAAAASVLALVYMFFGRGGREIAQEPVVQAPQAAAAISSDKPPVLNTTGQPTPVPTNSKAQPSEPPKVPPATHPPEGSAPSPPRNPAPPSPSAPTPPPQTAESPDAPAVVSYLSKLPQGAELILTVPDGLLTAERIDTVVKDQSGKGNDATVKLTRAEKFSSAPRPALQLPKSFLWSQPEYSFIVWFRLDPGSSLKSMQIYGESVTNGRVARIVLGDDLHLGVGAWHRETMGGWRLSQSDSNIVHPSAWNFVAVRLRNGGARRGELKLNINDYQADRPLQAVLHQEQPAAWLAENLEGDVRFAAIYRRALSDGEIKQIYDAGLPPIESNSTGPLARSLPLATAKPPSSPAATPKTSVPDKDAQARALAALREAFADEYALADKTSKGRADLAAQLLIETGRTDYGPTEKYVLLDELRRLASSAGDVTAAISAVDKLVEEFGVERTPLRIATAIELGKTAALLPQREALGVFALPLVDEAINANAFNEAEQLLRIATDCARMLKMTPVVMKLTARAKEVRQLTLAFQKVEPAFQTLKEQPDNPAANLEVGRFLCFEKQDWQRGLPLLAKGGNDPLAAATRLETGPARPGKAALADAWWDVAQTEAVPLAKEEMLFHAAYLYREALADPDIPERLRLVGRHAAAMKTLLEAPLRWRMPPGPVMVVNFEPDTVYERDVNGQRQAYVSDVSSRAARGEVVGVVAFGPGRVGAGALFDGRGMVKFGAAERGDGDGFTVSLWFLATRGQCLFSTRGTNPVDGHWLTLQDQRLSLGALDTRFSINPRDAKWRHMLYVKNADKHHVYIDGHEVAQVQQARGIAQHAPIFMGAGLDYYGLQGAFHGAIDEVAVYDRALDTFELKMLYELGAHDQPLRP